MKQEQNQTGKIEEVVKTKISEKESLLEQWQIIEKEANYLAKTDRSNLSWRELLSRSHECSN